MESGKTFKKLLQPSCCSQWWPGQGCKHRAGWQVVALGSSLATVKPIWLARRSVVGVRTSSLGLSTSKERSTFHRDREGCQRVSLLTLEKRLAAIESRMNVGCGCMERVRVKAGNEDGWRTKVCLGNTLRAEVRGFLRNSAAKCPGLRVT